MEQLAGRMGCYDGYIAEGNSGVLSDSLELLTDLMKHWEAVADIFGMLTIVYGSYKTAVILTNVATKGLLAVQTALNAAMKKNPIIWIITLIGSVVGALVMFREEVKTTAEVITDLNKTIADTNDKMQGNKAVDSLIDRYEALSKKANKSAEESRELGRITKNLANTFKDAVTQTDKYGVAYLFC